MKKKFENIDFFFFCFFFFLNFSSVIKGPEFGKDKNRKSGVRTFENLPDFQTGNDVQLSPNVNDMRLG